MPKKMTPKSQSKIKPSFPQYPFLTIFNPKKVSGKQIYDFNFNLMVRIYSNAYDDAISTLNYYEEYYEDKCLAGY